MRGQRPGGEGPARAERVRCDCRQARAAAGHGGDALRRAHLDHDPVPVPVLRPGWCLDDNLAATNGSDLRDRRVQVTKPRREQPEPRERSAGPTDRLTMSSVGERSAESTQAIGVMSAAMRSSPELRSSGVRHPRRGGADGCCSRAQGLERRSCGGERGENSLVGPVVLVPVQRPGSRQRPGPPWRRSGHERA